MAPHNPGAILDLHNDAWLFRRQRVLGLPEVKDTQRESQVCNHRAFRHRVGV